MVSLNGCRDRCRPETVARPASCRGVRRSRPGRWQAPGAGCCRPGKSRPSRLERHRFRRRALERVAECLERLFAVGILAAQRDRDHAAGGGQVAAQRECEHLQFGLGHVGGIGVEEPDQGAFDVPAIALATALDLAGHGHADNVTDRHAAAAGQFLGGHPQHQVQHVRSGCLVRKGKCQAVVRRDVSCCLNDEIRRSRPGSRRRTSGTRRTSQVVEATVDAAFKIRRRLKSTGRPVSGSMKILRVVLQKFCRDAVVEQAKSMCPASVRQSRSSSQPSGLSFASERTDAARGRRLAATSRTSGPPRVGLTVLAQRERRSRRDVSCGGTPV